MMIESCNKCQQRQAKIRCQLCKRGYCQSCANFVNGLCSSCLKKQNSGIGDNHMDPSKGPDGSSMFFR